MGGLYIHLCVGFARAAKHHGARAAACFFHQLFVHLVADEAEQQDGQHEPQQKAEHRRTLLHDLAGELRTGIVQALGQAGIVHQSGLVDLLVVLICKNDLVGLDIHLADVFLLGHTHKGAVVYLLHLTLGQPRHDHKVDDQQHQQHDGIVDSQRLFGWLDFFHGMFLLLYKVGFHPFAASSIPHLAARQQRSEGNFAKT